MNEPQQVLVANLMEALRQLQQYVVLGLGTSVSALALTISMRDGDRDPEVAVPGLSTIVPVSTARIVLLALCILSGAMAYYAVGSVNLIARQLSSTPDVLAAACTFPSIATSPYVGVRSLAALLPFVFGVLAVAWGQVVRKPSNLGGIAGWLLFLLAAYGSLLLELLRSSCADSTMHMLRST